VKYIGATLQYYDMETQKSIHYKLDQKLMLYSNDVNILRFYKEELFPMK
jgi:hypothetical protein